MRNESAFPYVINPSQEFEVTPGLSKREYFAAQILGDIVSDETWQDDLSSISRGDRDERFERIALIAVKGADALCKALEQPQNSPKTEPEQT